MIIEHQRSVKGSTIYIASEDAEFMRGLTGSIVKLSQSELKLESVKEKAA